jgi:GNAT superfamily N-acetyltransferase
VQLRQIDTDSRQDVARFVRLPFRLYRGSPYWVPPLLSEAKLLLDKRRHPYYLHSQAAFFTVEDGREVLGRLAVMDNRHYNEHLGLKQAFFGCLELVDDQDVAHRLFEGACEWAQSRGLEELRGPKELIGTDAAGILVEGFDQLPAMGVPYNWPYYDRLIKTLGFEKDQDCLGGYYNGAQMLPERMHRIAERVKARGNFWIKTFRPGEDLAPWVAHVSRIYMQAFASNYDFYPLTDEELAFIGKRLLAIVDPRLVKLVMVGDEVAGFVLAYPNFGRGLQRARGHLWPLGWWHLLRDRRRTKHLDVNGVGLLPAYQGVGANVLLYSELAKTIKAFGYEHIDVVHVGEDNSRSRSDQEAIGVTWHKRHRTYRRVL